MLRVGHTLDVEVGSPTGGLAAGADAGDKYARTALVELLFQRGDDTELERRADAGDDIAAERLGDLLDERGDQAELERRATAGDKFALTRLFELLTVRGVSFQVEPRRWRWRIGRGDQ